MRQRKLFSFLSDKPRGHEVILGPETVLFTTTFCLEDDDHKEVNFNGKTLIFNLQSEKIFFLPKKGAFKNLKLSLIVQVTNSGLLQKALFVIKHLIEKQVKRLSF